MKEDKSKGFVTVATGNIAYYKMAYYLMKTYRDNCEEQMYNFAIICDRENKYTREFDNVVVLSNPSFSWSDKMSIIDRCPYYENIFIDADCLIYKNINDLWEVFAGADDFSCFGKALPLDSNDGWFKKDGVADYRINFITHLHGVVYFIRKTSKTDEFKLVCQDIIKNYKNLTFKYFNDKIADEPVIALAMAIMNCKPIPRTPMYYCFVPAAKYVYLDYANKSVVFYYDGEGETNQCYIVHFGSLNTTKAQYRFEIYKIKLILMNKTNTIQYKIFCEKKLKYKQYRAIDIINALFARTRYIIKRLPIKIKELFIE